MLLFMGLVFMIANQGNLVELLALLRTLGSVEAPMEMPLPSLHLQTFGLTIAILLVAPMA
jgi:hypothetical protein